MNNEEPMLKYFRYDHLPPELQQVSKKFHDMAWWICGQWWIGDSKDSFTGIEPGEERTVALRKLLEAKDAAVRAVVFPGG